jgi:hypothetical protein
LKTNLVAVAKDDFLGLNCSMDYCFFLFLLLLYCLRREKASDGDVVGNRIRRNNKLAKKYIASQKQINNKEPFYVALEKRCITFESEVKYRNLRNE